MWDWELIKANGITTPKVMLGTPDEWCISNNTIVKATGKDSEIKQKEMYVIQAPSLKAGVS